MKLLTVFVLVSLAFGASLASDDVSKGDAAAAAAAAATATDAAAPAAPAPKESPKLSLKEKLLVAKDKIMAFEPKVYIDKASAMVEKARTTDWQAEAIAMWDVAKQGDIRNVEPGLLFAYAALVLMAIVPIYVGSYQSAEPRGDDEVSAPADVMTSSDAAMFPINASCALFGLYLLFHLFGKAYINLLLGGYFFLIGVVSLGTVLCPIVAAIAPKSWSEREFHLQLNESGPTVESARAEAKKQVADAKTKEEKKAAKALEQEDPALWIDAKLTYADIMSFVLAAAVGGAYLASKHWILNNLFGVSFAINSITLLQLGSFGIGATLLSGLFFYDVFWVFGTDVMVTVARSFDAPIKVIFPKDFLVNGIWATEHAMLGLGDIVIPGILIALLLRFDKSRAGEGGCLYFVTAMIAYVAGLVLTVFVMHTFQAAQPALLYLVPLGVLTPLLLSAMRFETAALFAYSDEAGNEEEDEEKKKEKKTK